MAVYKLTEWPKKLNNLPMCVKVVFLGPQEFPLPRPNGISISSAVCLGPVAPSFINKKAARVEVNISLAFLYWAGIALHP